MLGSVSLFLLPGSSRRIETLLYPSLESLGLRPMTEFREAFVRRTFDRGFHLGGWDGVPECLHTTPLRSRASAQA